MRARVFIHESIIQAPARDLLEWHEQPEALLELLPSRFVAFFAVPAACAMTAGSFSPSGFGQFAWGGRPCTTAT